MRPEDLKSPRLGKLAERRGVFFFVPRPLPPEGLRLKDFEAELEEAQASLDAFNALLEQPGGQEAWRPLLLLEGLYSAKIEGSEAHPVSVVLAKAGLGGRVDEREAINAAEATELAWELARELRGVFPELLKALHRVVMRGARGEHLGTGEFKTLPNFTGGRSIESAKFVYAPPQEVPRLVDNLLMFMKAFEGPPLVTAGLAHLQFEVIHPFPDGNGRVGRALIFSALAMKDELAAPALPLSLSLFRKRQEYFDAIDKAALEGDPEGWLRFFFLAVREAALAGIRILGALRNLWLRWSQVNESQARLALSKIVVRKDEVPGEPTGEIFQPLEGSDFYASRSILEVLSSP